MQYLCKILKKKKNRAPLNTFRRRLSFLLLNAHESKDVKQNWNKLKLHTRDKCRLTTEAQTRSFCTINYLSLRFRVVSVSIIVPICVIGWHYIIYQAKQNCRARLELCRHLLSSLRRGQTVEMVEEVWKNSRKTTPPLLKFNPGSCYGNSEFLRRTLVLGWRKTL